jgi:hypothetical protein
MKIIEIDIEITFVYRNITTEQQPLYLVMSYYN